MKITFLGAGDFGSVLSDIAIYNGHETKFYDPYKYPDITLHEAISGADVVVYAAPSSEASVLLPKLDSETPLICASKGFLSLKPFSRFKNFSAISGAGFSKTIRATLDAEPEEARDITLTASSELSEEIFSTEKIKIEYTKDTLGILLCGALKNIYAIGAGYYGGGEVSMSYLENVISEMLDLLEINDADKNTLRLSCGAADLVYSCSENSRNFRLGALIKKGDQEKIKTFIAHNTLEGINIIRALKDYPDFVIPNDTPMIKDIINLVKEQDAIK